MRIYSTLKKGGIMANTDIKSYKELAKDLEPEDSVAALSMTNAVLKNLRGRPYIYPPTDQGFDNFRRNSESYFEYLENANSQLEQKQQIIPDIEGYCLWLGIHRSTLSTYIDRGGEWESMINLFKDAIAFNKKQLALKGKIPPVMAIFDLTNNHGYHNANEFKLETMRHEKERPVRDYNTLPLYQRFGLENLTVSDRRK